MKLLLARLLSIAIGFASAHASAITTGPLNALPANSPWALFLLALAMVVLAFWLLRHNRYGRSLAPLLMLAVVFFALWQSPELRAQLTATFTNPAGETLAIPVQQIPAGGDIAGFEHADYTNSSGQRLTIRSIVMPDFDACFPGGMTGELLPAGAPHPAPPPVCSQGQTLANGATCRVDVDNHCRAESATAFNLSAINPNTGTASGGAGFTLTGTNLTGATAVTFDGIAATSVNVVNSTTVTGVTPAHTAGVVDVVINTPAGTATLVDGYTYETTAVGQLSGGGVIAALDGGLQNLIAATADNSSAIEWGGLGTEVGAQSLTDGVANTLAIVTTLGINGGIPYAAQLCTNYEVDSQSNSPCQVGNACYNDWFLPARNQLNALFVSRVVIGGFDNDYYWVSEEFSASPSFTSVSQNFIMGSNIAFSKDTLSGARCVRTFSP